LINISLSAGEFEDKTTSFGVSNAAIKERDALDFRKPRALAKVPSVSFNRPQWDANSSFARDIRPVFQEQESWDFEVRSTPGKQTQLTFSAIESVPKEFEVFLIDEVRAKFVDLRREPVYTFLAGGDLSKFRVLVGTDESLQERLLDLQLPKEFALGQNYPNPFNPTTILPLALPVTSEVQLKVFNYLGQEVITIFDGELEAGYHLFTWEGKNRHGRNLASGVYLARLTTNEGISRTTKMLLLK